MSDHTHRVAVMAGAGTGKTYSLVENYLSALMGQDGTGTKKRPSEILALTFTQKAANEMRIRITKRLSSLLSDDEEHQFQDHDEIRRILRAIPNAPIATFHGFCSTLIRREANAIGIDERFDILEPREEWLLARNVLRPIILSKIDSTNSLIKSLVARFRLSNGLLSLGLIDGLLRLYFKLSEKGIYTAELLAMSIANQTKRSHVENAIDEIDFALNEFLRIKSSVGTTERLAKVTEIFLRFRERVFSQDEFYLTREFLELRKSVKGNFGDKSARNSLVSAIVKLGAVLVDYIVFEDEIAVIEILDQFHQEFDQAKAATLKVSYGDLLLKAKNALAKNHDLRKRIKQGISHILVDEYQDTSPIQEDIIALLLENKITEGRFGDGQRIIDTVDIAHGPSLFVVGDKKQSIYGFRGADASLFSHMVKKMASGDGDVHTFSKRTLTVNRRSKKRIIDLINLVADHTLVTQNYDESEALSHFNGDDNGKCALFVSADDSNDKTQANLTCAAFGIADLLSKRSDLLPHDIVVLVRRIKSASVIKEHLIKFGISSRIVGGEGFFQQQEIVDVISALKLINDPGHPLATAVVLRSPLILLKDYEIFRIKTASEHDLSLLGAMRALENGLLEKSSGERLERFLTALEKMRALIVTHDLGAALDVLMHDCDLAYSIGLSANPHQKWANMEKLSAMLIKNRKNPFTAIDDLYLRVSEDGKEPLAQGQLETNAVTIMTIHQSKGLEFKVVVLADGESSLPMTYGEFLVDRELGLALKPRGRFIAASAPTDQNEKAMAQTRFDILKNKLSLAEREEVARLLYVALTRAREELYVVVSSESFNATEDRDTLIGLFLRAYHRAKDQFLAICDVINIEEPKSVLFTKPIAKRPTDRQVFKSVPGKVRIFASALQVSPSSRIPLLINRKIITNQIIIDGNLAHKLLALTGNILTLRGEQDVSIDQLVDAAFRALALPLNDLVAVTMTAVKTTLQVLQNSLHGVIRAILEMPLCSWPLPDLMIEGFADLVVEHPDFVGVIEFKSSRRLILDPNTYFQALAYAHALLKQFDKPIKFAVLLVGSSSQIKWQDYDVDAQQLFFDEVRARA